MRRIGLTLLFALALLGAVLAFWPMRAALGAAGAGALGLSAREVSGTLWSGRLEDARLGPLSLGDVRARLGLLPLLAGRTRLSLQAEDGPFQAVLERGQDRLAVHDLDLRAPLSLLWPSAGASAALTLSQVDAVFADGRCEQAAGRLAVDGLAGPGWTAPPLEGPLACDGAEVLARLQSGDGQVALDAELRMDAAGVWRLALTARPADPLAAAALEAQGFAPGPEGLTYDASGRLR